MNSLRLYTRLDMRNQSLEFMQANFGKGGSYYYWISRGVDNREVKANRKPVAKLGSWVGSSPEPHSPSTERFPTGSPQWGHQWPTEGRFGRQDFRYVAE